MPKRTVPGPASACPPKPSGKKLPAALMDVCIRGAMSSTARRANFCDRNCPFEWKDTAVDDGYRSTAPVGSYEAGKSPYGAYDMAGNVWEWVADWYDATVLSTQSGAQPARANLQARRWSCAAAHGSILPLTSVRPNAPGYPPTAGMKTSAYGACRRHDGRRIGGPLPRPCAMRHAAV